MKTIIKTQAELDSLALDCPGTIYIEGGTLSVPLQLKVNFAQAYVIVHGQAVIDMRGSAQVGVMWGSAQVREMRESAQVGVMRGSAQVGVMWGSAQVREMRESAQVGEMWESAQVGVMRGSAQVGVMWGSAQVGVMRESAQVELYGECMVSAYGTNKIICHGYNVIKTSKQAETGLILTMSKDSHLIVIPEFEPSFEEYQKRYPVQVKDGVATLYKATHKIDGRYLSDHKNENGERIEYIVGKPNDHECSPSTEQSCSTGLHVAPLSWTKSFGAGWPDLAILEVEVPVDKIVVSKDSDGKVRTSFLKVINEINLK